MRRKGEEEEEELGELWLECAGNGGRSEEEERRHGCTRVGSRRGCWRRSRGACSWDVVRGRSRVGCSGR